MPSPSLTAHHAAPFQAAVRVCRNPPEICKRWQEEFPKCERCNYPLWMVFELLVETAGGEKPSANLYPGRLLDSSIISSEPSIHSDQDSHFIGIYRACC